MNTTRVVEDHDVLEPDWYDARVDAVEESAQDGPYGPYLTWLFTTASGAEIEARSADSWRGDTKARRWYGAVLARPLRKGEEIDLTSIAGKPCRINLTVITSDKGVTYNRVADVAPPRGAARPPATEAAAMAEASQLSLDDLPI